MDRYLELITLEPTTRGTYEGAAGEGAMSDKRCRSGEDDRRGSTCRAIYRAVIIR
jgi:hypothetical protein